MNRLLDTSRRGLTRLSRALSDTLLPRSCLACGVNLATADHHLCALCWLALQAAIAQPSYCPRCGASTGAFTREKDGCNRCRNFKPAYQRLVRVGLHRGPLAQMIRKLKFRREAHVAKLLGELLLAAVQGANPELEFDLITPIPLHWWRQWCRGYNQAELLANQLVQLSSWPKKSILRRIRWTRPQTHLSRQDRLENVRGAFALGAGVDPAGKKILLIDDVLTTGATASEAASVLKKAGAEVFVAVAAVAGN